MIQISKQKSNIEKIKDSMEQNVIPRVEDCEEGSSYSSMSMYNLDSSEEDSKFISNRSPTIVLHDAPLLMHMEEVHSSPITKTFCMRGIMWFKKKIFPLVIISRKYLVLSLSTFTGRKEGRKRVRKVMEIWTRCRKMKYYLRKLMKNL